MQRCQIGTARITYWRGMLSFIAIMGSAPALIDISCINGRNRSLSGSSNTGADHRPVGYPEDEGSVPVQDQVLVEVHPVLDVVVCRAGKPCRHPIRHDRYRLPSCIRYNGDGGSSQFGLLAICGKIVEHYPNLTFGYPDRLRRLGVMAGPVFSSGTNSAASAP